jgi:hypothetical protein
MRKSLMASVAVAAIFGFTNFASAQSPKGGEGAATAPKAAPAGEPAMKGATGAAPKAGVSEKLDNNTPKAAETKTPDAKPEPKAAETAPKAQDTKPSTANSQSADPKSNAANKDAKTDSKTTGSAPAKEAAAPPAEKRSQITTSFKQSKVEEIKNVNFSINVGVKVPSTVKYHPIPTQIVEIYPEWRGYDFILVNGRYVILRPQTHEIVYIIEG